LIEFRGAMRDMVFKQRNGKLYASVKSTGSTKEPSAAQAAHRERFRKAVRYGKSVMSNDTVRPLYELVAAERNIPVFTVCITDYMKAPSIDEIDVRAYNGRSGDPINIVASDDFGVVRVDVRLTDEASGTIIESGQAVETSLGEWTYIATESIDAGSTVQFQVTASDRPGGAAVQTETKRI
jgi:hypothetical protein